MPLSLTLADAMEIAEIPITSFTQKLINESTEDLRSIVSHFGFSDVIERCSQLFIIEIALRMVDDTIYGSPEKIASAITELEGKGTCGTKKAIKFRKPPLKGLWHKHYVNDGIPSMVENIENELKKNEIQLDMFSLPGSPIKEMARKHADEISKCYLRRLNARKITGQWIIFCHHQSKNYYCCVGQHGEELLIFEKIKQACIVHFPFLKSHLDLNWAPQ